jgi:hypothetical protein
MMADNVSTDAKIRKKNEMPMIKHCRCHSWRNNWEEKSAVSTNYH